MVQQQGVVYGMAGVVAGEAVSLRRLETSSFLVPLSLWW